MHQQKGGDNPFQEKDRAQRTVRTLGVAVYKRNELRLFPEIRKATFIRRPNRFVVECLLDGHVTPAYMPNPGRLWELLLPESPVYLADSGTNTDRKYRYTAVAVVRDNTPILLHTHLSNNVVRWLIENKKLPGYEDSRIVKAEATVGRNRFDFILEKDGKPFFLEVKSCTQFGKKIAMFPDAVTERGRRHIIELSQHAKEGTPGGILFLVHWPHSDYFLPDYHTDLEFARALINLRNKIIITAVSVGWNNDLTLKNDIRKVEIPWHVAEEEAKDSGSYMLILELKRDMVIDVGKFGTIVFRNGFYIYVGSAKKNLKQRLQRHLRKRKNMFWHIDYLRNKADDCTAIAVRATADLECKLSKAIERITPFSITGFGSSDCDCKSHLFYMDDNPLNNSSFIDTLLHFRINHLHERLMKQNP